MKFFTLVMNLLVRTRKVMKIVLISKYYQAYIKFHIDWSIAEITERKHWKVSSVKTMDEARA